MILWPLWICPKILVCCMLGTGILFYECSIPSKQIIPCGPVNLIPFRCWQVKEED